MEKRWELRVLNDKKIYIVKAKDYWDAKFALLEHLNLPTTYKNMATIIGREIDWPYIYEQEINNLEEVE